MKGTQLEELLSHIDGQPRSATVVAQGLLRTFAIPREAFLLLLDDHPEIARGLLLVLCRRLRQIEASIAGNPHATPPLSS